MPLPPNNARRASVSFAEHLASHGDRLAVITDDLELTYRELDERVAQVAEQLGESRRLVLLAPSNDVDSLVTYLGALRAGHPVMLAAPDSPDHVAGLVETYDPDVVALRSSRGWQLSERRDGSRHQLHPDLALLLSTSGSTGSRKLVRLSRRNLEANADAIVRYLDIRPADRAATTLPMQYCYGLSVINTHLGVGAGLILTGRSVVEATFWDSFRAAGGSTFAGVPYTFELLERIDFEHLSLPALRYVTQAGGRLHPDLVRKYARLGRRDGWSLVVMYGQTEATARMAYLPPELAIARPTAIGVAIPGGVLDIEPLDDNGGGDEGELVYRGPNVMLGYAHGPADLTLGATVDVLRTGDIARRADDGLFELVGRRSRFTKLFGLRIDLDEAERLLREHDIDGLCIGDDALLVVATATPGAGERAAQLLAVGFGLPPSSVRAIELDHLPRLTNGKPDYVALRNHARASAVAVPSATTVRDLFSDLLRCEVHEDDTFVSLGGDSLTYVELSVRLEELLGDLPADWHERPVGLLAPATGRRRLPRVETNIVLRAAAIALIVANHAGAVDLPGGAHVLLAVAGFNFARFARSAGRALRGALRIAAPSMCWIGLVAALSSDFTITHALLVNGWLGGPQDRWSYWFVEVLVQILVAIALLLAVPPVRRAHQRHPFGLATAVTTAALAIRFDLAPVPAMGHRVARPHETLWLFALGWAAAYATSTKRKLVITALVALAVPGFFGRSDRDAIVAAGILLVVWVPYLPVPRPLNRLAGTVAGASLAIYLTHWQVYPLLRHAGVGVALLGSVVAGVAASAAVRWTTANVRRRPGSPLALPRHRREGAEPGDEAAEAWGHSDVLEADVRQGAAQLVGGGEPVC